MTCCLSIFTTDHDHGRGFAVMVFETRELADQIAGGLGVGSELRNGVLVTSISRDGGSGDGLTAKAVILQEDEEAAT